MAEEEAQAQGDNEMGGDVFGHPALYPSAEEIPGVEGNVAVDQGAQAAEDEDMVGGDEMEHQQESPAINTDANLMKVSDWLRARQYQH